MTDVYELFEYELYHQGKSPHTVRSYVSKTKHFFRWREQHLGANDLTKVADLDIKRYEAYCRQVKKYTPNSIRQRLSAIRAYCDFLALKDNKPAGRRTGSSGSIAVDSAQPRRSLAEFAY